MSEPPPQPEPQPRPHPGPEPRPQRSPSITARLAGAGVRGAGRAAALTGLDEALDAAAEEAIVRALESPAVERAITRVIESPAADAALDRTLASEELERALVKVLDSEMVDRLWERLLAGEQAQQLVERIAGAPEIRQALAVQGLGFLSDIGRRVRGLTGSLDLGLEWLVRRLLRRPAIGASADVAAVPGAVPVGLVTRAVAALTDAVILNGIFFVITAVVGVTLTAVFSLEGASAPVIAFGAGAWTLAAGLYLFSFWALAGQTPGMRFLSIHIEREGSERLGWRCALRRLLGVWLSIVAFGIPFLRALVADDRRAFHDRLAGTDVVAFDPVARWVVEGPVHPAA